MVTQDNLSKRDAYLETVHERLHDWERKVANLDEETHETRSLKAAWRKPVTRRVEPQLEQYRNRIEELRTARTSNWEPMRERVEAAEAELATVFEQVSSEFDTK